MPDMTSLNAAIDAYAEQSYGADDGGELSRQRSLALKAYAGLIIDEAPEGRSQVSDRAVFETAQWIMPSMMRIFAGGANIVEFEPVGEEDEEGAKQESDYLNYKVMQHNDYELTVREWVQDALITKNAYCLVDMEERLIPEIERYEGQQEEQLAILLEDKDVEVVGQKQYDDPDDDGVLLDPMTGAPIDPADQATMLGAMAIYTESGIEPQRQFKQLYDVDIKRVKAKKQLKFEVLDPENCRIARDTKDYTLEDCNYFEYSDPDTTISDLRKLGYDVEDDIASDRDDDSEESSARDLDLASDTEMDIPDPASRTVTLRTIWIRYDDDGDGIAELQRVVRVGNEILDHEPCSRIPVACIVPYINTHRHIGTSVADLVFDVQRIKTSMLRAGLDALQLANNPRHAISEKVTIDDMLTSRPGGLVRLKSGAVPGEGHILPLQTENTFPYAQQGLQHMDTVIESRVGVNRIFQGIDSSNLNDHDRIGQLSTMAAQRVEDIARLFAGGFKRLFSLAHELIIKNGHHDETVRLRNKWVQIDPRTWRTNRDMRIVAPFAAGNKDSLLQRLLLLANIQEKALAAGAPFVDMDNAYEMALAIAEAADVTGTKFFTDPETVPPKPPGPDYTMEALKIEDKKAENQAAKTASDAEIDKYKADLDAEIKQYQTDANAQVDIAVAELNAGSKVELEKLKSQLAVEKPDIQGALSTVMAKLEVLSAPKKVVRDKDGRVSGVE